MNVKQVGVVGSFLLGMCLAKGQGTFSTFGPEPYSPNGYKHGFGWSGGVANSIAAPFSFQNAWQPQSVTLDIWHEWENSPNLEIGLFGDDGGHPSLTPMAILRPSPTLTPSGAGARQAVTYFFQDPTPLQASMTYWLVLQPQIYGTPDNSQDAFYGMSSSTVASGYAHRYLVGNGTWSDWAYGADTPAPVFRLDGLAVPEPGVWALLGLGGLALWGARRRRPTKGQCSRRIVDCED